MIKRRMICKIARVGHKLGGTDRRRIRTVVGRQVLIGDLRILVLEVLVILIVGLCIEHVGIDELLVGDVLD